MADSKSIDLLAFCDGYPSKGNPSRNVFVHTFMKSIQRQGIKVSVIAPEPLFSFTRPNRFLASSKKFGEVDGIKVYRPMYISYSSKTLPFIGATLKLSMDSLSSAALRATKRVGDKPKIAYGHFLFSGGSCALKVARSASASSP